MLNQKTSRLFVTNSKANFDLFANQKHQTTCVSPTQNGPPLSRNLEKYASGSTAGERYGKSSLIQFDSGNVTINKEE
jgi:hypothetical protein